MKRAAKNSAIYSLGTISAKVIGLILLPLYTSYLTTEEYGILALLEVSSFLFVAIFGYKLNAALFRWYWEEKYLSKQKKMVFTVFFVLILSGLFLTLGIFPVKENISSVILGENKYGYLFWLMIVSSAMQIIVDQLQNLMRLQEKSVFFSIATTSRFTISLLFTIAFVAYFGRGLEGIYEAQIISQIVFFLICSKYFIRNISLGFEKDILKEMLIFGGPLIFAEISGLLLNITDRYCLNYLASVSDVGIYSISFKLSNTIRIFVYQSVMMALVPLIYQNINKPNNKRFYSKIMTYMTLGIVFFALGFSLFSDVIIKVLAASPDYWEAIKYVPALSLAIVFGIIKDVSLTGLNITKKTKIIASVVTIMAIINLILNVALIPFFGIVGAVLATLLVRVISFVVFYRIAQRKYFIPYELKKVITAISVGIVIFATYSLCKPEFLALDIFVKFSFLILFPIILYPINFYEKVEIEKTKEIVRKLFNK